MAGEYNAAVDLLERNLKAGRGSKVQPVTPQIRSIPKKAIGRGMEGPRAMR